MSLVDKLLLLDSNKVKEKPRHTVPMKRLSELLGENVEFVCHAVDGERYADIQRTSTSLSKKGGIKDFDLYAMQVQTIIAGVVEPSMKDPNLLAHFGAATPKDLVALLLLPGEIAELYNVISELSGYEREEDEDELKN